MIFNLLSIKEQSKALIIFTLLNIRELIDYFLIWIKDFIFKSLKIGYAVDDLTPYAKCPYDWDLCHANGIFESLDLNLDNAKKYIRGEDLLLSTDNFEDKIIVASYKKMPLGFLKGKKVDIEITFQKD